MNKQETFFNKISEKASTLNEDGDSLDAYFSGTSILPTLGIIREWMNDLREWDTYISARGPVEAENPFITVVGNLAFISDEYAHLQVVGAKAGFQAVVHIKPKYLSMIRVTLGTQWDANEIIIAFFLQVSGPQHCTNGMLSTE